MRFSGLAIKLALGRWRGSVGEALIGGINWRKVVILKSGKKWQKSRKNSLFRDREKWKNNFCTNVLWNEKTVLTKFHCKIPSIFQVLVRLHFTVHFRSGGLEIDTHIAFQKSFRFFVLIRLSFSCLSIVENFSSNGAFFPEMWQFWISRPFWASKNVKLARFQILMRLKIGAFESWAKIGYD